MIEIKLSDSLYPDNLKEIKGAPKRLFVEGEIKKEDRLAVAIVGARNMTSYGKRIAQEFANVLAKNKVTIVSGLAYGIDTVAHKEALRVGGRTIAVLGSGVDVIYPKENEHLARKIIKNGALVSEFALGVRPLAKNFLIRNRIISGLSKAVLVVEGKRRSGTLSTATHAANQGREVFAVPGPITSPLSDAPLYLIEQGASIAKSPKDILEYLRA